MFIHRWLNPHCPECLADAQCSNCLDLRDQLNHERQTNKELVRALVELTKPEKEVIYQNIEEPRPVSKKVLWHVKRATLEAEDKALAEELRKKNEETERLEKELNIG